MTLTRRQKTGACLVFTQALLYGRLVSVGGRTIKVFTSPTFNVEVQLEALDRVDVEAKLTEHGYRRDLPRDNWWIREDGNDDE